MKWIKCSDRLPEKHIDVLCFDGSQCVVTSFTGDYARPRLKQKPIWNDPTGYYSPEGEIDSYTHWTPLPESPNEYNTEE